ncbi:MAG: histidine phosphatase family protein [Mariprofundaceae bacterium]|nr:histidine phosphatase family protein [Mariprofundaceae bacterium]
MNPIVIDLIRHGEVAGRKHVARGRTDKPLSDEGWQQLCAVKECIGRVDQVATSPLKRCRLFAESCDEPVLMIEDMQEIDFGDWEDKSADEVEDQTLLEHFFDSPCDFQAPHGEAFDVFSKRVLLAWQTWLASGTGEHRILLAHGCVIRVILAHLLAIPSKNFWNIVIDPAGWTRVSCLQGEKPRVLFINRDAGAICKV